MTIKQVRILDVHPDDPRYEDRDQYIGNVYTLDVEDTEYKKGWQASIVHWDLANFSGWNLSYREVYAMKMEDVS